MDADDDRLRNTVTYKNTFQHTADLETLIQQDFLNKSILLLLYRVYLSLRA